jgi:hypothetical protein
LCERKQEKIYLKLYRRRRAQAEGAWRPGVTCVPRRGLVRDARHRACRKSGRLCGPAHRLAANGSMRCALRHDQETRMNDSNDNLKGPNVKKRPTCKNCKGTGLVKKGDREVKCQRCQGTGKR